MKFQKISFFICFFCYSFEYLYIFICLGNTVRCSKSLCLVVDDKIFLIFFIPTLVQLTYLCDYSPNECDIDLQRMLACRMTRKSKKHAKTRNIQVNVDHRWTAKQVMLHRYCVCVHYNRRPYSQPNMACGIRMSLWKTWLTSWYKFYLKFGIWNVTESDVPVHLSRIWKIVSVKVMNNKTTKRNALAYQVKTQYLQI